MGCCASKPESSAASLGGVRNQITKKNIHSRVQNWKSTGVVSLRDCSLTHIPPETGELESVKTLDATNNRIADIPESLFESVGANIQRLVLRKNALKTLDFMFVHLTRLKVLDVSFNSIESIDWKLMSTHAQKLKILNASHNRLKEVDVEQLGKMKMLEDVDVSGNAKLERLGSSCDTTDDGSKASSSTPNATTTGEEEVRRWPNLTTFAATKCNIHSISRIFLPPKLKTLLLDDNPHLKLLPRDLFQKCLLLQRVSLHNCQSIDIKSIEKMNGYSAFLEKVQQSHDKKIKGGVLLGSGYGDDGLDRRTRGGDERLDGLKIS
jgi:Leucine-rich repeat (LRR) protein